MPKIRCLIRLGEVPLHLYQITAGFLMLKHQGIIELEIEKQRTFDRDRLPYNMMEVIFNEEIKILYDLNDGYDNLLDHHQDYVEYMNHLLTKYDYYFKRSFSSLYNSKLKQREKIFPLGLNYMVTTKGNFAHTPTPCDPKKEKVKKFIRMLPFSQYYNGLYTIESFENAPRKETNPRILFMARLWDSNGDGANGISSAKKEERIYINEQRAKCISLCKTEFGDRFYGGITPSPFSTKYYPELVLQDKRIAKRNNYLKKVKESSICIATMGLHESIGWKFAEYISASRAIVTEELHYEVPGDFVKGENYLAFTTPEECVDQIYTLLNNDYLRYKMMMKNYEYYHQYVRPDRLVLNSLLTVLSGGKKIETHSDRVYAYI